MCALLFLIKKLCQDFARAFQTQLEDLGAGAKFGDILSHLLHLLLPYSLAKCLGLVRRHGKHALLNSLIFGLGAESPLALRVQPGAEQKSAEVLELLKCAGEVAMAGYEAPRASMIARGCMRNVFN